MNQKKWRVANFKKKIQSVLWFYLNEFKVFPPKSARHKLQNRLDSRWKCVMQSVTVLTEMQVLNLQKPFPLFEQEVVVFSLPQLLTTIITYCSNQFVLFIYLFFASVVWYWNPKIFWEISFIPLGSSSILIGMVF